MQSLTETGHQVGTHVFCTPWRLTPASLASWLFSTVDRVSSRDCGLHRPVRQQHTRRNCVTGFWNHSTRVSEFMIQVFVVGGSCNIQMKSHVIILCHTDGLVCNKVVQ